MEPDEDHPDCCFDGWAAANADRARSKEIAAPITRELMTALDGVGLRGRSVLDIGCGTGDLALATLARGASRAAGIDLGTGAIENAKTLAAERGLADRAAFSVGDGSSAELPASDVVILNRVVCCYPDARALLDNSLAAAGSVFAITAPVDRGPVGLYNRTTARIWNRWYALRRAKYRGFRTFVHDVAGLDERIRRAGFEPRTRSRRRVVWELAVYTREPQHG
jgi:magnesium-protoporphyrin O-methyltransferase